MLAAMLTFLLGPQPTSLQRALKDCRTHLTSALLVSAEVNLLYLAPTIYMMQVYDRVVPTGGLVTLLVLTLFVAAAAATISGLEAVRSRLLVRASLVLDKRLAGMILTRGIIGDRGETRATSGSTTPMREFESVRQVVTAPTMIGLFDAPWTPIYILIAFLIHPALGLFVAVAGAICLGLAVMSHRATAASNKQAHRATIASALIQEEVARHAELLRARGLGSVIVKRLLGERESGMAVALQAQLAQVRYGSIAKGLRLALQSLALGLGAWLAIERQISVGAIIAASVLLSRALSPIELLISGWPALQNAREALRSLSEALPDGEEEPERTALPAPRGALEATNLAYRAEGIPILKGVSFRLEAGAMLGVIGASGSGKSSLLRLLAGAAVPDAGAILYDDADQNMWAPETLSRHIGYLPQEPQLLAGTIAQNIGRFLQSEDDVPDGLDARIVAAAEAAGCHRLILTLPGGYDCPVGQNGVRLSAGQRQRIALAAALFDSPRYLILDEPNASLDVEGESALLKALAAAKATGATLIVAAHRTAVLAGADRLLHMSNGAVVREGPASDVAEQLRQAQAQPRNVVGL